jgi:hypothetical protein
MRLVTMLFFSCSLPGYFNLDSKKSTSVTHYQPSSTAGEKII